MDDKTFNELSKPEMTRFHEEMLSHCRRRLQLSRAHMQAYYDMWEDRHRIYRSYRSEDAQDRKAAEEGRPQKQVVPMTYAKVHTFKSFCLSLFTQRPNVFELDAQGGEDKDYTAIAEKCLAYDTKTNNFEKILRQHVVDIAKFGLGVIKHSWEAEYAYVPVTSEGGRSIFGIRFPGAPKTTYTKVPKRLGNRLRAVSPFDFYPDPRFPLSELQRGEFCADESDMSRGELRRMEGEKTVAGMKHLGNMDPTTSYNFKRVMRRSRINFDSPDKTPDIVRVSEMQIKITPNDFELEDGTKLGEESFPVMFVVWIANDSRVIRCEPMGYLHGEFTFEAAQFDEDQHDFINQSLSDILDRMQNTIDWFMNARVESVTRTIDNQLVVDPLGVEMSTIVNRSRVILLKKGAARTGVDRYVKQLEVQDVTSRHMEDISQLMTFMQMVSGVNENAMGQYHTGRRSATEARVVAQGAASRLKDIASAIWNSSIAPTGQKMLLNLRQGLDAASIVRIAGHEWLMKPEAIAAFTSTPEELVMQSDFFVYDGTLASEKAYLAQTLKELFETVLALGPAGLVNLEMSPKLILEKIYELLGVGTLSEFSLMKDPQTLQNAVNQIVQQTLHQYAQQLAPTTGQTEPQPDQNAGQ